MGEDTPLVPMDPLVFMLALRSMANAKYDLWGSGIPFTDRVINELDYNEFGRTRLTPSLTVLICVLALLIFFNQSSPAFLYISDL